MGQGKVVMGDFDLPVKAAAAPNRIHKLKMKEINQLTAEEKHLYLMKYISVNVRTHNCT